MTRAGQRFRAGSFTFLILLSTSGSVFAEAAVASETATAVVEAPTSAELEPLTWTEDGGADLGMSEDGVEQFSLMTMLSKLGLGLGVVVLLAWGVVALLKKSALGQQFGSVDGVIQVVGRNYLAPKKAIYLVHIGDRVLALGVTDAQIGLLSEWPAGEIDLNIDKTSTSFAGHMKSMVAGLGSRRSPLSEVQS